MHIYTNHSATSGRPEPSSRDAALPEFKLATIHRATLNKHDSDPPDMTDRWQEYAYRPWSDILCDRAAKLAQARPCPSRPERSGSELSSLDSPHRPLLDPYEIRLLELERGEGVDPLCGRLHHCSIEFDARSPPTKNGGFLKPQFVLSMSNATKPMFYTALSYAWGDSANDAVLHCGDGDSERDGDIKRRPLQITRNLSAILESLRRRDHSIVLWVDQVCINQSDDKEKAGQIPLMSRIYKQAWNTVGWLSAGISRNSFQQYEDDLEGAFGVLLEMAAPLYFNAEINCPEDFKGLRLPLESSGVWRCLKTILSSPWLSRQWIIQEAVLSRNLWLAVGNRFISFDTVNRAWLSLTDTGISRWLDSALPPHAQDQLTGPDVSSVEATCAVIEDLSYFDTLVSQNRGELFWLLKRTRYAQCFDPKDKVYGLLGLCATTEVEGIDVDYDSGYPTSKLYYDVAVQQLANPQIGYSVSKKYKFFSFPINVVLCAVIGGTASENSMFTWCPDWKMTRKNVSFGEHTSSDFLYSASGAIDQKPCPVRPCDDGSLKVRGYLFDTIRSLSGVARSPDLDFVAGTDDGDATQQATTNKDFEMCARLTANLDRYPGSWTTSPEPSCSVFDAFWKTLVANRDDTSMREAPDSFAEIFSVILDAALDGSALAGQVYSARQSRPKGRGRLTLQNIKERSVGVTYRRTQKALKNALQSRRLGITERGYLGLFSEYCMEGDQVYVLQNGHVPYAMRQAGSRLGVVKLVEECYVHGIMAGEATREKGFGWRDISIV
ncbi:HET domain-containing protein [Microdochium nivale]|nr:HET domain-containing protein [Microdochium nivale]